MRVVTLKDLYSLNQETRGDSLLQYEPAWLLRSLNEGLFTEGLLPNEADFMHLGRGGYIRERTFSAAAVRHHDFGIPSPGRPCLLPFLLSCRRQAKIELCM